MTDGGGFAATVLQNGASALAGFAAATLEEADAGTASHGRWKSHLTQRVLELATAVRLGAPALFVGRVQWERNAWRARGASDAELRAALVALADVLAERLPAAAADAAQAVLREAIAAFDAPPPAVERGLDPGAERDRLALEYMAAILDGDAEGAVDRVLRAVADGLAPAAAFLEVLVPALRETGRLWHAGKLAVYEEHLVTETTRRAMTLIAHEARPDREADRTVVAAAVEGNAHELSVRVVADFFRMAGWRVVFLGGDCPAEELALATRHFSADLAAISATVPTHLPAVERTVRAIREATDGEVPVLVGGSAFADAPDLWKRVGADGYAESVDRAAEVGARLVDARRA